MNYSRFLKRTVATAVLCSSLLIVNNEAFANTDTGTAKVDTINKELNIDVEKEMEKLGQVTEAQVDEAENLKSIEEYNHQISTIKVNIGQLENLKQIYKTNADSLKEDISVLNDQIEKVKNKISALEESISKKEKSIEKTKQKLLELYAEIEAMEAEKEERELQFKDRVHSIQRNQEVTVFEVLLESKSFGDMINRFVSYKEIVKADNQVIEEYLALIERLEKTKKETEELQNKLKKELKELENHKAELLVEQAEQEDLMKRKERQSKTVSEIIQDIDNDIKTLNNSVNTLNINKNSATIKAELEKQVALKRAKEIQENKVYKSVDLSNIETVSAKVKDEMEENKIFVTPTTGRFTSGFGYRVVFGQEDYHYGIDLANAVGTPVYASAEGEVLKASPGGSYGNVIYIRHKIENVDYVTVYAHLSAIGVKAGDTVEQGQVIGLMGSTGRSSGPHLHFEIQVNTTTWNRQKAIDPWKYLSDNLSDFNTRKEVKEVEKEDKQADIKSLK